VSEPNIQKFFSLSVIYRVNFLDLLRLYDVDVNEKQQYETVADPYLTQLTAHKPNVRELFTSAETLLIADSNMDGNIVNGRLGLTDFTMYPMIRPGALLRIDTSQNKLISGNWHNEYERPIFFIELRDAYACGWCELQGNQLLIIPHLSSLASVRQFTYP